MQNLNESQQYFISKCNFQEAIQKYSNGIDAYDYFGSDVKEADNLKVTLLSNRAACYLKGRCFEKCAEDCTEALALLVQDDVIRCKLLYRRAKAWFLSTEGDDSLSSKSKTLLQDAAKDLLQLLSIDAKNTEAATLLHAIRAKHDLQKGTPVKQTLIALKEASSEEDQIQQCNILLGLITNDESMALDVGQCQGIPLLLSLGSAKALQVLSCASSNPRFVQLYGSEISQDRLTDLIQSLPSSRELAMPCLSIWLRLVLYLDPLNNSPDAVPLVNQHLLLQSCRATFSNPELLPATLDVLSTWTTLSREDVVRSSTTTQHHFPILYTEKEFRKMKPREVAAIRKEEYERQKRDKEWAKNRAVYFCKEGGLRDLLEQTIKNCRVTMPLRKQIGLVMGRILASIQDDEVLKNLVQPFLGSAVAAIEEVFEEKTESDFNTERLDQLTMNAFLVTSLLFSQSEVGAWGLTQIKDDISELICSSDPVPMAIASELVSAAASNEKARASISYLIQNGALQTLVEHPEQTIRSGAASAIAKLGLATSNQDSANNEENDMELLQIATELLDDSDNLESNQRGKLIGINEHAPLSKENNEEKAVATTSIERGIEVLGYLASKTNIKEELAHGFRSPLDSPKTALQRLVELASIPGAGESISSYALATIFGLIAVSNETLRREAFEGKDISMEQYDELQSLGKTEEEKAATKDKLPDDNPEAVQERIRKLADANAPQAMVKLMDGSSDTTIEALVIGLNRMATEASVRGLLIQQGVLSACIKLENDKKNVKAQEVKDKKDKIAQGAYQCVARLLITTNPAILTTSQRMGSIKPLIQLVRDNTASDLQHFEALLAITNLASSGYDAKDKIVSEKGIPTLSYAMFSDHELVRKAGTEAMCNLIPHPAMMKHLADEENLRLWLAFAASYEENFECARAAIGCLAMSTDSPDIAKTLVGLKAFRDSTKGILESGNLELMHRVLVMIQNLMLQGDKCKKEVEEAGLVAFCHAYVQSYHDGSKIQDLEFNPEQEGLMTVTIALAKDICKS